MQLSKLENKAYESMRKNNLVLFKVKDLSLLLDINRTQTYNLIKAMKKKNIIKKIRAFFVFKDADEFVIATSINSPSYISFWTALNYYHLSDQTPRKIFLATTRYSKEINNFKYVTLSKKRFFGYINIGGIIIAEKEKAIVDSLLFPKYSGGIKEIFNCLKIAIKELNIKKLIDYAIKIESKAVLRRLGFLLEILEYKIKIKGIGKGYELLDPTLKRKNNLNKKWFLDINW